MTTYSTVESINNIVFKPCGLELTMLAIEEESRAYFAHTFKLDSKNVVFRTAKITPTKTGQFVTLWKRNEKGITTPFDIADDIDIYMIAARKDTDLGLFIFPKMALHNNHILSDKTRDGKRGFRVYPSWDFAENKQAQKTQHWQSCYFVDISDGKQIDFNRVKELFLLNSTEDKSGIK